jgi:hypothetical protein
MIQMKEINSIPAEEYSLIAGEWDFYIEDPERLKMQIVRIIVRKISSLKNTWEKLHLDNKVLVKIKHVRGL